MSDQKLQALPNGALRALIERQMASQRKAQAEIAEMDTLIQESLAGFMQRVDRGDFDGEQNP